MPQDQQSDQGIELSSLLSIRDVGTQRLRSSSTSSNQSLLDGATHNGQFDASNEHLLSSRKSSDTSHSPRLDRRQSQSQLSIDLEASLLHVPLDAHTNQNERSATNISGTRVGRSWCSKFNSELIRSLLHQTGSAIYDTSCRVVEIDNPSRKALSTRKKSTGTCTNESTTTLVTSATSNMFSPRYLMIPLRRVLSNIWIQPVILLLILFQLVILIIDTTDQNAGYQDRLFTFRSRWKDPCYIVIFIVYTIELGLKSVAIYHNEKNATTAKTHLTLKNFYNILDLLAVVSFWINFIMLIAGASESRFRQILAMMSALRILRLLRITAATRSETTILFDALKESGPKLAKVASFICFFWLLFAVIGVQTFKSSLRRSCVVANTSSLNTTIKIRGNLQFCGGHLADDETDSIIPLSWLKSDGSFESQGHRGYLCPRGMVCQEGPNPYNGTVSFDNIFQSLELVFVTFSANTFSTLMYSTMDSDGLPAALFFAAVIVVLYFWLLILLIGIITGSIQEVREKSQSAVSAPRGTSTLGDPVSEVVPYRRKTSFLQDVFAKTKWFWIAIITLGLVTQAYRSSYMSNMRRVFIERSETAVTFVLLFEIILRFALNWKNFHHSKQNITDLSLAIITSLMQLPFFKRSYLTYAWFTGFQVARSYRVFWAITPVRDIMIASFSYFPALLQLCGFLFLLVFLSSVLATQLFASVGVKKLIATDEPFSDLWKSFLGMYQIFTGEDWTTHLYAVTQRDSGSKLGWIGAIFVIGWFALSSIIVLNMFLSRIDDGLNIPDDRKRFLQVRNFFQKVSTKIAESYVSSYTQVPGNDVLTNSQIAAWTETQAEEMVDSFLGDDQMSKQLLKISNVSPDAESSHRLKLWASGATTRVRNAWQDNFGKKMSLKLPFLHHASKYYTVLQNGCRILLNHDEKSSRYAFGNFFKIFINFSIISQVIITCVTTPFYQRQYWAYHTYSPLNWFVFVDLGFALLWSLEAVVKIIVGGIVLGPDAYLRGWNLIDAIVLVTSWTSLALTFYNTGRQVAVFVASFKAFRVLRLLTLNKKVMRQVTFVFRRGSYKVFASILVSLSLLVPFAVFGVNLFVGLAFRCNDPNIINFNDCIGEFIDSDGAAPLTPRVVSRPFYNFDDFGKSFYTLFLIVSQEGWTDVMYWARGLSGAVFHVQEKNAASNINALFFVVFNLLGTIFVTALFASVMIQNYTEATGVAYLTYSQKAWIEQTRLLRRVRPSRRPPESELRGRWKDWCYNFAAKKDGKWHKLIIAIFAAYLTFLCIDFYPSIDSWNKTRDIILLALMLLLLLNITIRIIGLSFRLFLKRPWDRLSLILITCGLATSAVHLRYPGSTVAAHINSVAQDMIPLLLIPYVTAFRDLFDIAVASVPLISTLLVTWFVLLLFFAIGLTQAFGLTRFGPNETGNVNFRTVPKALILLFRLTLGEGRTKIMEDFAAIVPPYCTVGERYFESDCGDAVLARTFFIMWKVLSTYLFTSLFVSLVYESFSNVYRNLTVKAGTLTRGDLRQFKNAWALVDPNGTGFIPPTSLAKFTSLIHGVLNVRVYDERFSIANLQTQSEHILPLSPGEINLGKLNTLLESLPIQDIRERRRTLKRYRMELLLTQDTTLGISLQTALITLIYYSLLESRDYMSFQEYVERENRLRQVDEALRMESVAGLIKMYRCKQILRKGKESLTMPKLENDSPK